METLHVHSLHARYRLVPSAAGERARLDHILDGLLADALVTAAATAGLEPRDELCVRRVESAVRVPARTPDRDVARLWAEGLVDAVARELRGADVVRYRSRTHALLDLATRVPHGDVRRAWAWRQLGLWEPRPLAGDADAAERTVAALCSEPETLVAALVALARDGDALPRLADLFAPSHWATLAETALTAAGAPDPRRLSAVSDGSFGREVAAEQRSAQLHTSAERITRRSELVRALLGSAATACAKVLASPRATRAVAAFAVLEVEPAAARDVVRVEPLLDAVTVAVRRSAGREAEADRATARRQSGAVATTGGADETRTLDPAPAAVGNEAAASHLGHEQGPQHEQTAHGRAERTGPPPYGGTSSPEPESRSESQSEQQAKPASEPVDAQRTRAWTRAGGLLFLLNVLDELELGDGLAADDVLAGRPFRWSLHRLAQQLAPVGADDPAALAFAGLPPEEDPPSLGEPPPTDAELERVAGFAEQVVEHLRERLERPDDPQLMLLDSVCRHRAEIVADPGWIEARFSVDDADPELRRAALDLDPGWLPWLGAVVVFTYD